ncbi:MAG: DUF5666 domain-containing protein [Anaerolineae bacterium]
MRPWIKFTLFGVLALALAVGGFVAVQAVSAQTTATHTPVPDDQGGLYLRGTLTAATATELTVTAGSATWKVQLDANTVIHVAGKTSAAYTDLVVDQWVTIQGEYVSSNTLKANVVSQSRLQGLRDMFSGRFGRRGVGPMTGFAQGQVLTGTVVSTTENSITLKKADNSEVSVAVNADTRYLVPGNASATLADITAGMTVYLQPADASAQTPATIVLGLPSGYSGKLGRGFGGMMGLQAEALEGTVVSTTATSITLKTEDNTEVTVAVNADTRYMVPGNPNATLADIAVGTEIHVWPADASGQVAATQIAAVPAACDKMMNFGRPGNERGSMMNGFRSGRQPQTGTNAPSGQAS